MCGGVPLSSSFFIYFWIVSLCVISITACRVWGLKYHENGLRLMQTSPGSCYQSDNLRLKLRRARAWYHTNRLGLKLTGQVMSLCPTGAKLNLKWWLPPNLSSTAQIVSALSLFPCLSSLNVSRCLVWSCYVGSASCMLQSQGRNK